MDLLPAKKRKKRKRVRDHPLSSKFLKKHLARIPRSRHSFDPPEFSFRRKGEEQGFLFPKISQKILSETQQLDPSWKRKVVPKEEKKEKNPFEKRGPVWNIVSLFANPDKSPSTGFLEVPRAESYRSRAPAHPRFLSALSFIGENPSSPPCLPPPIPARRLVSDRRRRRRRRHVVFWTLCHSRSQKRRNISGSRSTRRMFKPREERLHTWWIRRREFLVDFCSSFFREGKDFCKLRRWWTCGFFVW